jgi:hypothetical protein
MEAEDNQTVLYLGTDRDGDQIQIVGHNNGDLILRVRDVEQGITCGIYIDSEMMLDLISTLLATKVVVSMFGPPKPEKEAVQ